MRGLRGLKGDVLIEGEAVDDGFEVEGEQSEEIIDVAGFFQVPLHGLVEHGAEEREVLVLFGRFLIQFV